MSPMNLTIIGAFVAGLVSVLAYGHDAMRSFGGRPNTTLKPGSSQEIGRFAFYASSSLIALASLGLLIAFLRHDFQFAYVAGHSSRGLNNIYLVSAFWAGQEGSLLLWALFGAVTGLVLIRTCRANESTVMQFFALTQFALLILLLKRSPFALLAQVPADGMGLNPLLMDPWMAIHPPIIFMGYATIAAPFALAMAALYEDDYSSWIRPGIPWTLASWVLLGAGIIIGARWAYTVLGWGGYWGWDPVENASLVPWLTGMALLHTLLVQKTHGRMVRTNIALAVVTYLLIIYGTFLTRSGVLADFSVHSFADLGLNAYLVGMLGGFAALSLGLFLVRMPSIAKARDYSEPYDSAASRDFGIFLTALLLIGSGLVILLGTSAPLITGLMGNASSVQTSFYNITNTPIGILIALLLGLFPVFAWGKTDMSKVGKALIIPFAAACVLTLASVSLGPPNPIFLFFLFAAYLAMATNLAMIVRTGRGGAKKLGGYITHVGVALIFIGIVTTSVYDSTERLVIRPGTAMQAQGYTVVFKGSQTVSDGRVLLPLRFTQAGRTIEAVPYIQQTRRGTLRHPYVHSTLMQDLYVAPLNLSSGRRADAGRTPITASKGESFSFKGLKFTFVGYDMSQHVEGGAMAVGAVLKVETEEGAELGTMVPILTFGPSGQSGEDVGLTTPAGDIRARLTAINASAGTATLSLGATGDEVQTVQTEELLIEISTKPLVNLLWLGSLLLIIGTCIAVVRRSRE